jgi:hypothetical protein
MCRSIAAITSTVPFGFFLDALPKGLLQPGPLHELVRTQIENPLIHLTITGLGGTRFEPRVPTTNEVLRQLDPLIMLLRGEPERILWRFDPILKEAMDIKSFTTLSRIMGGHGIKICVFSFPSLMSLKGSLDEQYQSHGLSRWSRTEKRDFANRMAEIAARVGLTLWACNQPQLLEDTHGAILPASCISAELAQRLHPRQLPLVLPKDPTQRRHCNCVKSDDIGHYQDLCQSGCVYCYSSAGGHLPSISHGQ